MSKEIEFLGNTYSIGNMSVRDKFHVNRRIIPLLPKMIPIYMQLANGKSLMDNLGDMPEVLGPFAAELAALPDQTLDYVIDKCMGVVQRKHDRGWSRVWSGPGGVSMFDDIDLDVMLPLVTQVLVETLGPFIRGLLTSQGGGPSEKTSG